MGNGKGKAGERRGNGEGRERGWGGGGKILWEEVHGSARHTQRASGGPFHPVHFAHFNLLLHTIIISELFPGTLACRGHSCNTEN